MALKSVRTYPLIALRALAAEPDEEQRRARILDYIEHVWDEAQNRVYLKKDGGELAQPDLQVMRDIALALPELMGVAPPTSKKRLPDLGVFGKKAG